MAAGTLEERFADDVAVVVGNALAHADRQEPFSACCRGLILPGQRKSVEPMAARAHPDRAGQRRAPVAAPSRRQGRLVRRRAAGRGARAGAAGPRARHRRPVRVRRRARLRRWSASRLLVPARRRYRFSQEGSAPGRGRQAVLRRDRQAGQLPGRGQPVRGQRTIRPACRSPSGFTYPRFGRTTRNGAPKPACRARSPLPPSRRPRWRGSVSRSLKACRRGGAGRCRLRRRHGLPGRAARARAALRGRSVSSRTARSGHPAWARYLPGHGLADGRLARGGSRGELASRLAACRVRPGHRDHDRREPWPELWLLVEWPEGEDAPTKSWLANLPAEMLPAQLVGLAKLRGRIERDDRELKQELGLGPFEGRSGAALPTARVSSPRFLVHRGPWLSRPGAGAVFPSRQPRRWTRGARPARRFPPARRPGSAGNGTCRTRSRACGTVSPCCSRASLICVPAVSAALARLWPRQ